MNVSILSMNVVSILSSRALRVAVLIGSLALVGGCSESSETGAKEAKERNEAVTEAVADTGSSGPGAEEANVVDTEAAVKSLYQKSCISCHVSGAAGAPRTGDQAAWQQRIDEKGMDSLIDNVVNGIGSMPPTGLCSKCSREDYRNLILYMAK